ncbi:MAG: SigE family RNA polymerase sigma factor [Geodermatophilaceae bacterium]
MDGDDGFRDFVESRWGTLVATAYLVTADRGVAEDCVQEALARVHRRWRALQREGDPEAYARRSVINAALSWRRRRRVAEVPLPSAGDPPAPADASARLDAELMRALRALPPRMRAVVVLRYVEDRSEVETADLLGCSVGTVKSTGHRGLARLRQYLESLPTALGAADGGRP